MILKTTFSSIVRCITAVAISAIGISSAHALVMDTKIGSADLGNSGDPTELAAVKAASGNSSLTFLSKISPVTAIADPSTPGQFYIDLSSFGPGFQMPAYFALKFGTGGTSSAQDTFFFTNISDLTKLVFASSQVNFLAGGNCGAEGNNNSCNIERLSHFDTFSSGGGGGGSNGNVPEPATIALFGLGLLGYAATRRKSAK